MFRIFFIVFIQTAIGGVWLMSLVPPQKIGKSFFRLLSLLYLTAMLLAYWAYKTSAVYLQPLATASIWRQAEPILIVASIIALCAYSLSLWMNKKLIRQASFWIFSTLGLALLLNSSLVYANRSIPMSQILLPLNFLSSALLLGATNTGMLLGHWYLVSPRLPLQLLRRLTAAYLVALVISSVLITVNLLLSPQTPFNLFAMSGYGIYFWSRIGIGILASWALGGIIWMCVKEGSTRAATGFLYIAMLTVFAGEMWGRFLLLSISVPL